MAGRKRKAEAARVLEEEADRPLYSSFRGAANSLSQLYALAGGHQRLSFHAGERHAMDYRISQPNPNASGEISEKLYRWILQQNENGLMITVSDIASRIQHEIEYGGEDVFASPRSHYSIQNLQASVHIPNTSNQQASPSLFAEANPGLQPKNSMVFCDAISSHVEHSLQPYHLQQDGGTRYFADGIVCTAIDDLNAVASNDSSMDIRSDKQCHES